MKTAFPILALIPLVALVGCRGGESATRSAEAEEVQAGSDLERLQGMWEIVEFRTAREGDGPNGEKQQAIRLVFAGDRLTISVGTDWKEHFTVSLDPTKDPRHMTLVEESGRPLGTARAGTGPQRAAGPGERSEWIYKFEGDTLVIAVADPDSPRPTEFTPKGIRGNVGTAKATAPAGQTTSARVDVVRLRKTTVPASAGPRYGTAAGYGTYRYGTAGGYRYSTSPSYSTYRGGTYRGTAISPKTSK
jgi:uncharacterized protein (TIGR03067 family)